MGGSITATNWTRGRVGVLSAQFGDVGLFPACLGAHCGAEGARARVALSTSFPGPQDERRCNARRERTCLLPILLAELTPQTRISGQIGLPKV